MNATARVMNAGSSAYTPPGTTAPVSPTSRSTRSSIAARSRPGSPPARAATSPRCATPDSCPRSSTRRSCGRSMATWRSATCATRAPAVALPHTGNLTNAVELWGEHNKKRINFRGTSDSEIMAALLSSHDGKTIEDAVEQVMPRLEGAYSTVVMTKHAIVAFRDPHGIRPLSLGRLGDRFVVASESCAFDIIGAELMREVHPGEMGSLTERGLETRQVVKGVRRSSCVFEHIYFSRPDSRMEGKVLQQSRGKMGEILWRESPVDADLVISVPDSGNPAAAGFARASGLPRDDGLIKNRYVARTFIQPGQELRKHGLRLKFNPLPEIVAGKRLVVVDDSIVRGNTTRPIAGVRGHAGG